MKASCILLVSVAAIAGADTMPLTTCLAAPVRSSRRSALHQDPFELQIVEGMWKTPVAGQEANGVHWSKVDAGKDGSFQGPAFQSGYADFTVNSATDRIVLLEASGDSVAYVNQTPQAGDPYQYGYVSLPIHLRRGSNELLFVCGRGGLKVSLVDPPKPVSIDLRDSTLPDLVQGERGRTWAAVVVRNATDKPLNHLSAIVGRESTPIGPIPPLGVRKIRFALDKGNPAPELRISEDGRELDRAKLTLRVRKPGQTYKRTFVSTIDGSVQYYAVNPCTNPAPGQALFLSLHGAGVEAIGQADAYSPKNWGAIVCPTNRRPYGFDWEDEGRLDALEVLQEAQRELRPNPAEQYLTGHSMGGHGTWTIGAHFPDRFAAIAPSAGWISFWSYAGGSRYQGDDPIGIALQRSSADSDTLAFKYNYAQEGIYILHGEADDNVPVTEERTMRKELEAFHHDLQWHEQPGANHWWDASDEPGADCVDWAPIFDMFSRHRLPSDADVRDVDFTTCNPGSTATDHWATIDQQQHQFEPSRIQIRLDPFKRRFVGVTDNVARLHLDTVGLATGSGIALDLDDQKLSVPGAPASIDLTRTSDRWAVSSHSSPDEKGPARYGLFKSVFRNRVELVYGTHGSSEENAWALSKARFDAETFWYRGNGSMDVIPDSQFDPGRDRDRNVVLYGNAETNSAWNALLGSGPVQVDRSSVTVGSDRATGADLCCLFVRPRPGSELASVGAISGTGIVGMRLADRIPIFLSGAGFPDLLLLSPDSLSSGLLGVRAAGFFDNDWGVAGGDIAWRK